MQIILARKDLLNVVVVVETCHTVWGRGHTFTRRLEAFLVGYLHARTLQVVRRSVSSVHPLRSITRAAEFFCIRDGARLLARFLDGKE